MKSQSAMEYLMTYGWAILVIAVVLAALYSLGIFNPNTFAPKASAGSCEVVRPFGPTTTTDVHLEGTCTNMLPKYVATFNGKSYVNLSNPQSLQFNPGQSFTFSAWVKTNGCQNGPFIGHGMKSYIFAANWEPPNCVFVGEWWGSSTDIQGTWGGPSIPENRWIYLTVVNNVGNNFTFYVDGSEKFEQGWGVTYTYSNVISIGSNSDPKYFFSGSISNIQIYNKSLSANQISALYQEGIGGDPIELTHLVGWWPLNGNADDYSGNKYNGKEYNVGYSSTWYRTYSAP